MVVAPGDWADWLDPANAEKDHLLTAMHPAVSSGSGGLAVRRVSTEVNSVRNNGSSLIEAVLASASGVFGGSPGARGDGGREPPMPGRLSPGGRFSVGRRR
jgi:hypothetical protein